MRTGLAVRPPFALAGVGLPGLVTTGARVGVGARLVPAALAGASGLLYTLAQPPADLTHIAWICLVPVLGAIGACRSWRGAALCGLGFAMVFSALVAGWLRGAIGGFFAVSPLLGWLGAGAVYLLFAGGPFALFGALAHGLLRSRHAAASLAGVPALWVATELVRAHVAGGLPWALLGHALYRSTTLIQIADLAGVSGVSFVIVLVNTALLVALRRARRGAAVVPLGVALAAVGGAWLYGHARLAGEAEMPAAPAVRVGVLQPDQAPAYHVTQVTGDRAFLTHARLSQQYFRGGTADLVVWPENAIPFYLERDPRAETRLTSLADALGAALIVGAPAAEGSPPRYFNAAHLVVPGAGVTGLYRKQRLVPFAEYRPLGWDGAAAAGTPAFSAGDAPVVFSAAHTRWGPSICLDIIYADLVRRSVLAGAEVLVNLSNDSWLAAGGGGAAAQQFAQTVFRAVENRRDVVRAATTGISAVVGADGVPRAVIPEHRAGAFVALVHARRGLTPYTRCGDAFAVGCVLLAAVVLARAGAARRRDRSTPG